MKIIDIISKMWNGHAGFSLIGTFCFGLLFFVANEVVCWSIHYVQREFMIEYGYKKPLTNNERNKLYNSRITDKVFLLKLYNNATKKGLFMLMCLICNILACCGAVAAGIGFLGSCITRGDGWAMTLLVCSGMICLLVTGIIEFFPTLICLPSERERYKP